MHAQHYGIGYKLGRLNVMLSLAVSPRVEFAMTMSVCSLGSRSKCSRSRETGSLPVWGQKSTLINIRPTDFYSGLLCVLYALTLNSGILVNLVILEN